MMKEWYREELASFLENKLSGLVYLYTPLCGTCQIASQMLRVVGEIKKEEIGMMNINFYPDIAENFTIESVPCLMLIKEGRVVHKLYAFRSVPYLLNIITESFE